MDSAALAEPNPSEWVARLDLDVQTAGDLVRILTSWLEVGPKTEQFGQAVAAGMEVVEKLAPMGLDRHCLTAGLVYPAEEQELLDKQWLQALASAEALDLLTSASRLGVIRERLGGNRLRGRKQSQAQIVRNMVLALSDDLRVTLLRLAERSTALARAVRLGAPDKRNVAREVLRIYAPIAGRLGVHRLKNEMEDLCLRALAPKQIGRIASTVQELRDQWEAAIGGIAGTIAAKLQEAGIDAQVESRIKNLYSIWRKMRRKGVGLDSMHDVLGIRIIVGSVPDCYLTLSHVHGLWAHLAGEFDDYIGNPKPNGYRSIHTAVVIPRTGTLEVQIRTTDMEREAEYGACAHWRYKGDGVSNPWFDDRVRKLRKLADQQSGDAAARLGSGALAEILLENSMRDHIYVFTRDGDAVELPRGATLLDFAYHVHTDVGHRCIGGLVNGMPTALDRVLRNGQSVEVTTGKDSGPKREWLDNGALNTVRARHSVQRWFRRLAADRARESGERLLLLEIDRHGLSVTAFRELAKALKQRTVDDLLLNLGRNKLNLKEVRREAAILAGSPPSAH